jgi:hypothetical protein
MEIAVDGEEEVAGAAVEDDLQVAVAETVDGGDNSIGIPVISVFCDVSQVFFYTPIVGKRAEIHSATGGACRAEQVFVPDGKIEGAMSAHAEAGDGAMCSVGDGGVMSIDVWDKLFAYKGFIPDRRVDRAVEIPAVVSAVGRYEEDVHFICFLLQLWGCGWPLGIIAAVAVKEVDDGETGGAGAAVLTVCFCWLDDDAFNVFVHGGTVDEDGVDAGREGFEGEEKKEREKEFHAEVFGANIRDEE